MQQGLGFIHAHAYNILSMPELVLKFNTFKLRWFPLFAVFTPLNVWTDEGQPCDYFASCSVLPAFRMCTHHYTTCVGIPTHHYTTVGIPIFRHQSYPDKRRLPKVHSLLGRPQWKWASHGEKDEGFIPALQEKLTAAGRMPSTARLTSFESRGVRTWPGKNDLELIPIDILLQQ